MADTAVVARDMTLDAIPTSDLLDTVMARFDEAVFVGMSARTTDGMEVDALHVYHGDLYKCAGLCADVQRTILAETDGADA